MKRCQSSSTATIAIAAACLALALAPSPARAGEVGVIVAGARPGDLWSGGIGGYLGLTVFNFVGLELEGLYQDGELDGFSASTGAARAYAQVTIGRLVPYAGLAAGVYRQAFLETSESGTYGATFVGLKFKFPVGVVLRAEYQWLSQPSDAPLILDQRYSAGIAFSF
jgi:hypothetical protein